MKNFIILFIILFLTGCSNTNVVSNDSQIYEVRSYLKKENGWIYYMNISYDEEGIIHLYNFNGINDKLDEIEGIYMPAYENGIEVEKLEARCNCLNYYQKYKKEYNMINDLFQSKKFQEEIKEEDLSELEIKYYNKKDLVELFNNAINKKQKRSKGKYDYVLNTLSRKTIGGEWTIVTDGSYGYIEIVNIEYKNKKGQYLSEKKNKTKKEKEKEKNIKKIEKYIIDTQEVKNIKESFKYLTEPEYEDLFELISKIGEYDITRKEE